MNCQIKIVIDLFVRASSYAKEEDKRIGYIITGNSLQVDKSFSCLHCATGLVPYSRIFDTLILRTQFKVMLRHGFEYTRKIFRWYLFNPFLSGVLKSVFRLPLITFG